MGFRVGLLVWCFLGFMLCFGGVFAFEVPGCWRLDSFRGLKVWFLGFFEDLGWKGS